MQYNPEEYNEILNIFRNESEELIAGMNEGFLTLEKNPQDKTPIKKLLQLSHSLKGASRMIGFYSVQDIAHKIEDILSYWNNKDVKININFFQVVYDICDFLEENIENSIKQKNDIYDNKVISFLNKLNNFITLNRMVPVKQPDNINRAQQKVNNIDINAIILELMFLVEMDSGDNDLQEILTVISENLNKLSDIFINTDYDEIKKQISLLISSLKAEANIENDLAFYKQKISELRNSIYSVYKDLNVNIIKQDKNIEEKLILNEDKDVDNTENENLLSEKFNFILANLQKIKYQKSSISEIISNLKYIKDNIQNEKIINIITKNIDILEIFLKQDSTIDNEYYIVILQCIYLAKKIYSGNDEQIGNLNFLLQRLSIVEDMLNVTKEEAKEYEISNNRADIVSQQTYKNFNNNITSFNIEEIKTLRVDISKLDNLIAQTGELLSNGYKNSEHISVLSEINNKLVKWESENKKIINYMRYYERKGFLSSENSDVLNIFYKKLQNFFNKNMNYISELSGGLTNFYNKLFEDDNKFHQTVLEIESIAKGIRVLPLATIFHTFPRMIRDISIENNKKVDFIITGSDITVDKKIIEEIKMPLVHILRNSISHGIETPEERIKNNKNETGVIKLSAKQEENYVIITIEDDGYGLNIEKIKKTAIQKNILLEDEINNMTNEQIMKLIFLPGFSTKESVSEISGRGVGLDVVKTKIAGLNGDIIVDSIINKGCKVSIKVPISMSSIKVFILMADNEKYAIPINAVKFVKKVKREEIYFKDGKYFIIYNSNPVPINFIASIFNSNKYEFSSDVYTVMIFESQEIRTAFIVDKLLGSQEVFQKKLMPPILKIKNISGFTTLSNGETCLIINPYEIIRYSQTNDSV